MTHAGPEEWGERLSDRVRAAIRTGDLRGARRLAVDGDGEARSLAKEYALMYKGLGITLRVLLALLDETVRGADDPDAAPATEALGRLLARFRCEMLALMRAAYRPEAMADLVLTDEEPSSSGGLDCQLAATRQLLAAGETVFSREQARLAADVVRALEAGDGARAGGALDRKELGQYVPLHDRMIRFMAEAFGYVLEHFGAAALEHFHLAAAQGQRHGFEGWERLDAAQFARATAFLLKQHMGRVEVREDPEKFTIVQRPCGSGGRLRLAGAYAGPGGLPLVDGAGALTLGQTRFPVYCSHCPIWNSLASIEWFGHPHWVFEDASRPDGSCTLHVYKRRDAVPAAYYRLLGVAGGR